MTDSVPGSTHGRLRELFDACAEMAPAARDAFLLQAGLDAEMHARLRAMLEADEREQGIFETPATVWAERVAPASADVEALVGTTVASFQITALLGHGGSAVVFRAERQVAGATQAVALKLLRTGLFSNEAQRRFRREQSILTQLSHPNIAHLIDAGISASGIPYIAMELVDGLPLTHYAQVQALSLSARLRLLVDVANAVDAAHRALVVHRDLKPSNVLVNAAGQVKVLDFGIAKLIGDDSETATLQISLTPGYAAPEQYHSGAVTTAVDVYALGVIASELLLDSRLGADAAPARDTPDAEAIRRHWRALDDDLATLLRTALAADPARRYVSARHFADDIGHFLRNEPIRARAPSRRYRARKFFARHRGAVFVSCAFLLAVLAALALALEQARNARSQAARADGMRDFMFEAFAEAEPSVPRAGPATVLDAVRRAIDSSARASGTDARARLELRTRLAQVLHRQGDLEGAGQLYAELLGEATRALGPDDALADEIARLKAHNAMARGQFDRARAELDALLARAPADRGERAIGLLSLSGVLASRVRQRERAMRDARQAVVLARALADPEILRQTLNDYGVVQLSVDALPDAVATFEELLAINRQLFGEQHQKVANVQAGLARAYRRLGDLERAETAVRAAIAIDRQIYPGDNWNTALHLNSLMMTLDAKGDLQGALAAAREGLRINRVTLGDEHADTLVALYGVGSLEIKLENYAAAVALLHEALIGSEKQFGMKHWGTAVRRAHYGYALAMQGDTTSGTQELERAIADFEALVDADLDKLTAAIEKRVRLALHVGDDRAAQQWIDRLARHAHGAPVQRASWSGNLHCLRGETLLASGDASGALHELMQAQALFEGTPEVNGLMRAEHALLLATALQASGDPARAATQASLAREHLQQLQHVPTRLRRFESALPR